MTRFLLAVVLLAAAHTSAAQGTHVLVIVGLGGDPETSARFHEWADTLVDTARGRGRIPPESVIYLGEDPARDPERIGGRSTREGIAAAVDRLASRARPGDRVLVVLIGHGAAAAGEPKFNLPGRDFSAAEFARLLDRFRAQTVAFVNTASASGAFIGPLAGRDRVVITATKGDGERNQTRFAEFFVEALTSAEADLDKDGRVSMLESFTWARQRTVASYEKDGQILTEHALLDDDGDGKGTATPGGESSDGALARTVFVSGTGERAGPPSDADPALRALYEERRALEERIATLKAARDGMDAGQYQQELERLLLELARKSREIREKEKR
ncbi:MAG: hypothetical protein EHM24_18730 [Acidobacteria bacterium]|nr:MAG: hypothetical protein EHM24_18730 [Acidobacteriota bacterium]